MAYDNFITTQALAEIIVALACFLAALILKMNSDSKKSLVYIRSLFVVAGVDFLAEACAYIYRGDKSLNGTVIVYVANYMVFILNVTLIYFFVLYILELLKERHIAYSKKIIRTTTIISTIAIFMVAINPFIKWVFYFDEDLYYHRNFAWYLFTALTMVATLQGVLVAVRYRKKLGDRLFRSIIFYAIAPIVGTILQALIYGIAFINLGITVSMFVMLSAYIQEWKVEAQHYSDESSIKKYLRTIILFVMVAVTMCISFLSCIWSINTMSIENTRKTNKIAAQNIEQQLDNLMTKPLTVSETMTKDLNFIKSIEAIEKTDPLDSYYSIAQAQADIQSALLNVEKKFGYTSAFVVIDSKNLMITDSEISTIAVRIEEYERNYSEFLKSDDYQHYDVVPGDPDDSTKGYVIVAITKIINDNGKTLGVCGVGVDRSEFLNLIAEEEKENKLRIRVVSGSQKILLSSDPKEVFKDFSRKDLLSEVNHTNDFAITIEDELQTFVKFDNSLMHYLVITEERAAVSNSFMATVPGLIIFFVGMFMCGTVFVYLSKMERIASEAYKEKSRASETDELTSLRNRHSYVRHCEKLEETGNYRDRTFIMMDVNGLKRINDTEGHDAGDALLVSVADIMNKVFGRYGNIYRIGGDEFVGLLSVTKEQLEDALNSFEHLAEISSNEKIGKISVAMGIVSFAENEKMNIEEARAAADKLMYEDKAKHYEEVEAEEEE